MVVRMPAHDMGKTVAGTKSVFQKIYQNHPFNDGFVDADIARLYMLEQQMGKLFDSFSVLSIIVSSIGLFCLATFAIQWRLKHRY